MAVAYIAADDPRRSTVAKILIDRGGDGGGVAINWAYWLADRILGALDDLHVHDTRFSIGWDDETEPDE